MDKTNLSVEDEIASSGTDNEELDVLEDHKDKLPNEKLVAIKIEPEVVIFKEEPTDGEIVPEIDQDPILYLSKKSSNKCLFCPNDSLGESIPIQETTKKIEYVLGTELQSSTVACCSGCWKTFQSFYKFKKACLLALSKRVVEAVEVGIEEIKTELEDPADFEEKAKLETESEDSAQITCKICFRKFKSAETLYKHKRKHREIKHSCKNCDKKFYYTIDFKKHSSECFVTVTKTDPERIPEVHQKGQLCKYCNYSFPVDSFKSHQKQCEHRPKRRKIQCPHCPKQFTMEKSYQFHLNYHNGIRTVQCRNEGCTKMFTCGKRRYEHEKVCRPPENPFICPVCGAQLRTDKTFRTHVSKHKGLRFECELCEKRFSTKRELIKHTTVHTGQRNFPCETCGKRFKSYEAHRVHQRIHTQEMPYGCTVCGQKFRYNCLLKTHMAKGH